MPASLAYRCKSEINSSSLLRMQTKTKNKYKQPQTLERYLFLYMCISVKVNFVMFSLVS